MKKYIKYPIWAVVAVACILASVRIESMDEYRSRRSDGSRDFQADVERFWQDNFREMRRQAVSLAQLEADPSLALTKGNTVGLGAPYSVCVKLDRALVLDTDGETAGLDIPGVKSHYRLRYAMIFSRSLREASKAFKVDDYTRLLEFNQVATELNLRIEQAMQDKFQAGVSYTIYAVADIYPDQAFPPHLELVPFLVE